MNKILSSLLLIFIILALVIGIDFWKEKKEQHLPGKNEQYYRIVSLPLPDSMFFVGEEVPLDLFYVREALDKELSINTYWHSSTLQLIKRTHRYFPMIEEILRKNNIPDDFKYLAVI
ncbi:MAG: murein transglycosylase, partial [Marinilabiliales bacterium]